MDLVLIRHGKAEEHSETIPDEKRALTADGKKKLLKIMPNLTLLIKNPGKVRIWTSRLDRAVQSAEVIARLFNITNLEYYDFIGDGDYEALLGALSTVEGNESIIIVGHEPYLGEWSRQISGQLLPFKKAAAACIQINDINPIVAELQWFLQPKALEMLGEAPE